MGRRKAWVAGGMRNLTTLAQSVLILRKSQAEVAIGRDSGLRPQRSRLSEFIDKSEKKCPRVWNLIFSITFPLLVLIGWAMGCGHMLAKLERQNELEMNNSALSSIYNRVYKIHYSADVVKTSYDTCLTAYINEAQSDLLNSTEMVNYLETCTGQGISESQQVREELQNDLYKDLIENDLSFNWNICSENEKDSYKQGLFVYNKWYESYLSIVEKYDSEGIDEHDASSRAADLADGGGECIVNSAGGAMFWFTIMTTIGYGNAAPVTIEGRLLVILLGFFSILGFTACIGSAAYVGLCIIDDFFKRINQRQLTEGWLSVMFWFSILSLWILAISGISVYYTEQRYTDGLSLWDAFWFSYISITTVGFGDFHIRHDKFTHYDMLFIPICMLAGFVFLANFLLKFSEKVKKISDTAGITDDESLNLLLQLERRKVMKKTNHGDGVQTIEIPKEIVDDAAMPPQLDPALANRSILETDFEVNDSTDIKFPIGSPITEGEENSFDAGVSADDVVRTKTNAISLAIGSFDSLSFDSERNTSKSPLKDDKGIDVNDNSLA